MTTDLGDILQKDRNINLFSLVHQECMTCKEFILFPAVMHAIIVIILKCCMFYSSVQPMFYLKIRSWFTLQIMAVSHFEFTRTMFSHHIVPGQAVKQFTSTSCLLTFSRNWYILYVLLYIPDQRYSANWCCWSITTNVTWAPWELNPCHPIHTAFYWLS
jgi:hypothetical protein